MSSTNDVKIEMKEVKVEAKVADAKVEAKVEVKVDKKALKEKALKEKKERHDAKVKAISEKEAKDVVEHKLFKIDFAKHMEKIAGDGKFSADETMLYPKLVLEIVIRHPELMRLISRKYIKEDIKEICCLLIRTLPQFNDEKTRATNERKFRGRFKLVMKLMERDFEFIVKEKFTFWRRYCCLAHKICSGLFCCGCRECCMGEPNAVTDLVELHGDIWKGQPAPAPAKKA